MASQTLTIRRPDDWHVHLRDGEMLQPVAPYTARQFARAIVMPNLAPPVTDGRSGAAPIASGSSPRPGPGFTPLMTCYLTDDANPDELARGFEEGVWIAAKLYPAGATTNSAIGRHRHPQHLSGARADAADRHGAVRPWRGHRPGRRRVRPRGGVHRPRAASGWSRDFPALKIVFEHITTADAVRFRRAIGANVARDGHAAASDHQPQCHLRWRAEAPRLLPAGRQAREAPARGAQSRDLGLAQILPRHRQRAARARGQGIGLRLRRHLQRAVRARKLCDRVRGGRRARPLRGIRVDQRRRASTACRSNEDTVTLERADVQVPDEIDGLVPFHAGETLRWRMVAKRD